MDVKPAFLTTAPRLTRGLADTKHFPLRSLDAGLTITPLELNLATGVATSGKITQRAAVIGAANGSCPLQVPAAEVLGTYFALMRSANVGITYTRSSVASGSVTAAFTAGTGGTLKGYLAQRRNGKQSVTPDFANGTLPAVTAQSKGKSLQERSVTNPVYATVQDLNVGGVLLTTDGSGEIINPGTAYRGTLSSYAARTDTGVYSIQFRESFTPGTVFMAVHTGANGSASAVFGASPNIVTLTTFASGVATNFASGTIGLFWFSPMSKTGSNSQSVFKSSAIKRTFIGQQDFPVSTNLQNAVLIPFQLDISAGGDIITTGNNTLIPEGVKIFRDGTTFTVELGRCNFLLGFASAASAARGYALTTTNLASQGRCSFTGTFASTIITGWVIAAGTP